MTEKTNASGVEIEVKFAIPNYAVFSALKNAAQLGDFKLVSVGKKITIDRYLDTSHKHIMQAGFACRIRSVNQQHILTLKALTPPEGAVHRRQEIEAGIPSAQPQQWPEGKAKALVLSLAGQESLEVLFTIHQTRYVYHALSNNLPIIELSLDEVSLGEVNQIDFFELEAELLEAGDEADLARFVDTLQDQWSLQFESRSKFERALAQINN